MRYFALFLKNCPDPPADMKKTSPTAAKSRASPYVRDLIAGMASPYNIYSHICPLISISFGQARSESASSYDSFSGFDQNKELAALESRLGVKITTAGPLPSLGANKYIGNAMPL